MHKKVVPFCCQAESKLVGLIYRYGVKNMPQVMAISMRQTRLSNIKFVLFLLNLQTHPYPKYSDMWHKTKFKQRCGSYQFPPNNHKSNPQHIWNVFHRLIQWVQAPIRPGLIAISWGLRLSNGQVGGLRGLCLELPGAVGFHNSTHSLYSLYI
jgi:hypothetical protein